MIFPLKHLHLQGISNCHVRLPEDPEAIAKCHVGSIDILINHSNPGSGTHVGSHSHSCCSCRLRKRSKANQSPSWRTETSQPNAAGIIGRLF